MELEGLLKRHYTTVAFFQGTMMNAVDLERVKVQKLLSFSSLVSSSYYKIFLILSNKKNFFLPQFSLFTNFFDHIFLYFKIQKRFLIAKRTKEYLFLIFSWIHNKLLYIWNVIKWMVNLLTMESFLWVLPPRVFGFDWLVIRWVLNGDIWFDILFKILIQLYFVEFK